MVQYRGASCGGGRSEYIRVHRHFRQNAIPDPHVSFLTKVATEMPTKQKPQSKYLHLTPRGIDWLENFETSDREVAKELLAALTLVSHTAFERSIDRRIRERAQDVDGPIALFATREVDKKDERTFFEQATTSDAGNSEIDAVARGSDLGSEAGSLPLFAEFADQIGRFFLTIRILIRCVGLNVDASL